MNDGFSRRFLGNTVEIDVCGNIGESPKKFFARGQGIEVRPGLAFSFQ